MILWVNCWAAELRVFRPHISPEQFNLYQNTLLASKFSTSIINSLSPGSFLNNGYTGTDVQLLTRLGFNRRFLNLRTGPIADDDVRVAFNITDNIVNFFDQGDSALEQGTVRRWMKWFFGLLFSNQIRGGSTASSLTQNKTFRDLTPAQQRGLRSFAARMAYIKKPIFPDEIAMYYGDGERIVLEKVNDDYDTGLLPRSDGTLPTLLPTGDVVGFLPTSASEFENFPSSYIAKGAVVEVRYRIADGDGCQKNSKRLGAQRPHLRQAHRGDGEVGESIEMGSYD